MKSIPKQKLPKQSKNVHFLDTKLLDEKSSPLIFVDIIFLFNNQRRIEIPQESKYLIQSKQLHKTNQNYKLGKNQIQQKEVAHQSSEPPKPKSWDFSRSLREIQREVVLWSFRSLIKDGVKENLGLSLSLSFSGSVFFTQGLESGRGGVVEEEKEEEEIRTNS